MKIVASQCTKLFYFHIKPSQVSKPKTFSYIGDSCVSFPWATVVCSSKSCHIHCILFAWLPQYS